ncbi:hypothetical protein KPH14_007056 [Odynerus spinipes]|uniref:SprT-like domain-containing protein n=1 Tax=Odynerus spinipes TaxID=1348599 RepID=A0AAD9RST1_9HYME|nr:hypothetical protein KPH14_007056 [Odynerus spinipes]
MSDLKEDFFSLCTDKQSPRKVYQILPKSRNMIKKTAKDISDEPELGSQDFCLKLSDDSMVEDSKDFPSKSKGKKIDNDDIIVISDSSSNDCSDYFKNKKVTTPVVSRNKYISSTKSKKYTLEISDTSDEDEKFYQAWKSKNKRANNVYDKDRTILQTDNSFYTSDSSSKSSSLLSSDYNTNSNIYKGTHIGSSLPTIRHKNERCDIQIQDNRLEQNRNICTPTSNLNSLHKFNNDNNSGTNYKKPKTFVQLTRGDINKILKNIQSTKAIYESPKLKENNNVIIDESMDEEMHPAFLGNNSLMRYEKPAATVIDETPSNPELLENQSSQANILTTCKTYNNSVDAPIDNQMKDLSERKRKEIAHWLMTNSPGSHSDSSFTNIAASSRNSISSGNSSLERFEMNYETPNNRGKIIKSNKTNEKIATLLDRNKKINSTVSKQKTNEFLYKTNDNVSTTNQNNVTLLDTNKKISSMVSKEKTNEFLYKTSNDTSKSCDIVQKKKSTSKCKNVDTGQAGNMDVMECADILDKLYGNIWRDKADALLTPTEKQNVIKKDRAVQTERKAVIRSKHLIKTGGRQQKSNTNETPQAKSTSKKQTKYRIQRNSFINDISSSDSEKDSLYYTALTTPRTSDIPRNPVSTSSIQRVIEICDSETEEDESSTNQQPETGEVLNRRRLSFSDEESSSGTSEYDPGDEIPQKRVHKKGLDKAKRILTKQKDKYPVIAEQDKEKEKHNSFLASLSDSVPIGIAHPDARKYRVTYKNNKEELSKHLYKLYNEKVFDKKLPEDMSIEWNVRMRGTAGYCYNKKSVIHLGGTVRSSRIVLATKILDTPDRLRDTLIHEMCHAAAWLINNISDGHGPVWTAWANKAMKVFPELPPIRRCHDYKIKTKFTYRCIGCGYSIGRHSKSLDTEKKRCGHCYGKFELLVNKTTKSGTVQMQTPKREPSAFALYVKNNYSSVKKERNLKHAEARQCKIS